MRPCSSVSGAMCVIVPWNRLDTCVACASMRTLPGLHRPQGEADAPDTEEVGVPCEVIGARASRRGRRVDHGQQLDRFTRGGNVPSLQRHPDANWRLGGRPISDLVGRNQQALAALPRACDIHDPTFDQDRATLRAGNRRSQAFRPEFGEGKTAQGARQQHQACGASSGTRAPGPEEQEGGGDRRQGDRHPALRLAWKREIGASAASERHRRP